MSIKPDQNVAVLGAKGFIGTRISEAVVKSGRGLLKITRDSHGGLDNVSQEWFYGQDIVVHAAGKVPAKIVKKMDFETSVRTAKRIFASVERSGVSQLILLSSSSVYGTGYTYPIAENAPFSPTNTYGEACVKIEQAAKNELGSTALTIIRPFNAYGPGGHGIVDRLIISAKSGKQIGLHGKHSIRDYIHVDNIAESIVRLLGVEGVVNLGTGRGRSTMEITQMAIEAYPPLESLVTWKGEKSELQINSSVADVRHALKLDLPVMDCLADYLDRSLS